MKPANFNFDFNFQGPIAHPKQESLSTGFSALDVMLPHGGWPIGAITEIFYPDEFDISFAMPLLWPALAKLSQAKRWLTLIGPPNTPSSQELLAEGIDLSQVLMIHPHATTNGLWAVEQALRAGHSSAVISWVAHADQFAMQDLRGAAMAGNCCGLLFRPEWAMEESSAAMLRLRLTPTSSGDIYVERMEQRKNLPHSALFVSPKHLQLELAC